MRMLPLPTEFRMNIRSEEPALSVEEHVMYRQILGRMLYVANWTRPELSHSTSDLSRCLSNPTIDHMIALLHVAGYLKRAIHAQLTYGRPRDPSMVNRLWAHVDSSHACCSVTRASLASFALQFNGAAIQWKCKRSDTVLDSTASAEYAAPSLCTKEVRTVTMTRVLDQISFSQGHPAQREVRSDSQAAIAIANNDISSARTHHIDIRFHCIREAIHAGYIHLVFIGTAEQTSDIFTKALPFASFYKHAKALLNHVIHTTKAQALRCSVLQQESCLACCMLCTLLHCSS